MSMVRRYNEVSTMIKHNRVSGDTIIDWSSWKHSIIDSAVFLLSIQCLTDENCALSSDRLKRFMKQQ